MRVFSTIIQRLLIFTLAGCFLLGCIATTPAVSTRFYVLTPVDPAAPSMREPDQAFPLSIQIAALRLPQYLEKPQIVTRSGSNQLELAEYHQWGGNLRKNMIHVLAQNFSQLLATADICMAPFQPASPPVFIIELEVMQFEADAGGKARLWAQWRLFRGTDKKNLTTRITRLVSAVGTLDYEHRVSAMSGLLAQLSRIIGQEILIHVSQNPGSMK
ncbi:MAG: PqiC family protein [Pseudomonadota bacterium]